MSLVLAVGAVLVLAAGAGLLVSAIAVVPAQTRSLTRTSKPGSSWSPPYSSELLATC
jgi:hypothetical protein